jgi:hypothetical protein
VSDHFPPNIYILYVAAADVAATILPVDAAFESRQFGSDATRAGALTPEALVV